MHLPTMKLPSVPLASPPTATCTPGRDGIPNSPLGSLLCGTWATHGPHTAWQLAHDHWPLAAAALGVLLALRLAWMLLRRQVWRVHAGRSRWLEIVPPVTATPAATVGLWRLLATLLPAPRRLALRPARLVWEVAATREGMRCGLWLPPGLSPTAVGRVLQRAWPGARTHQAPPPAWPADCRVVGQHVASTLADWQPFLDEDPAQASWRPGARIDEADDRLRAVYDALAAAGRTGGGLLQVHVCRAPRHRIAVLRRATVHPERAPHGRGSLRALGLAAGGLRALLLAVLDFVTPGPSMPRSPVRGDPYAAEQARQARAKLAGAPHLLVAVHAIATGPTRAAARAAVDDLTSGYGLVSPYLTRHRLHRPTTTTNRRWVPPARMNLAAVSEVAALAGLPAEPAAHGLPGAASRRRAAGRDIFTLPTSPDIQQAPYADHAPPRPAIDPDDDTPPTLRSTP